jgi:hypothetical protein
VELTPDIEQDIKEIYETSVLDLAALEALAFRVRKSTLCELLRIAKRVEAAMGSQPAIGAGVVRVAIENELEVLEAHRKSRETT